MLLAACSLLVCACSKDETPPETIPFKDLTAEPSVTKPQLEESGTDGEGGSGASGDDSSDTTANQPKPTPKPGAAPQPGPRTGGGNISGCCSSLNVAARIEKDPKEAARLRQAAGVCASINKVVQAGRTSRAAALRQVRAVAGSKAPGSCR